MAGAKQPAIGFAQNMWRRGAGPVKYTSRRLRFEADAVLVPVIASGGGRHQAIYGVREGAGRF